MSSLDKAVVADVASLLWPTTRTPLPAVYLARLERAGGSFDVASRSLLNDHTVVANHLATNPALDNLDAAAMSAEKTTQRNQVGNDTLEAIALLDGVAQCIAMAIKSTDANALGRGSIPMNKDQEDAVARLHALDRTLVMSSFMPLVAAHSTYIVKTHFKSWSSILFAKFIKPRNSASANLTAEDVDSQQELLLKDPSAFFDSHVASHKTSDSIALGLSGLASLVVSARSIRELNNKELVTTCLFPTVEKMFAIIRATVQAIFPQPSDATSKPGNANTAPVEIHQLKSIIKTLTKLVGTFGVTMRPKNGAIISICTDFLQRSCIPMAKTPIGSVESKINLSYPTIEEDIISLVSEISVLYAETSISSNEQRTGGGSGAGVVITKNASSSVISILMDVIKQCKRTLSFEDNKDTPNSSNQKETSTDKDTLKVFDGNNGKSFENNNFKSSIKVSKSISLENSIKRTIAAIDSVIKTTCEPVNLGMLLATTQEAYQILSLPVFTSTLEVEPSSKERSINNNNNTESQKSILETLSTDPEVVKVKSIIPTLLILLNKTIVKTIKFSSGNGSRFNVYPFIGTLEKICTKAITFQVCTKLTNLQFKQSAYSLLATCIDQYGSYFVSLSWKRIVPQILDDIDVKFYDPTIDGSSQVSTKDELESIKISDKVGKMSAARQISGKQGKSHMKTANKIFDEEDLRHESKFRYKVQQIGIILLGKIVKHSTVVTGVTGVGAISNGSGPTSVVQRETILKNIQLIEDRILGLTFDTLRELEKTEISCSKNGVDLPVELTGDLILLTCVCLETIRSFISSPLARREMGLPIYISLFSKLVYSSVRAIREISRVALETIDTLIHPAMPRIISPYLEQPVPSRDAGVSSNSKYGVNGVTSHAVSMSTAQMQQRLQSRFQSIEQSSAENENPLETASKPVNFSKKTSVSQPIIVTPLQQSSQPESNPSVDKLGANEVIGHKRKHDEVLEDDKSTNEISEEISQEPAAKIAHLEPEPKVSNKYDIITPKSEVVEIQQPTIEQVTVKPIQQKTVNKPTETKAAAVENTPEDPEEDEEFPEIIMGDDDDEDDE